MAPKQSGSSTSAILAVTVLGVLFFAGYRMGNQSETESATERAVAIRGREGTVRKLLDQCELDISGAEVQQGEMTEEKKIIQAEKQNLKDTNQGLYQENERIEDENAKCIEEGEQARQQFSEADEKNQLLIASLHSRHASLVDQSKQLDSTKGMRYVLLSQAIRKARAANFDIRGRLKLAAPPADYEATLTQKWANAQSGDVLPVSHAEMARVNKSLANWKPFIFDEGTHKDIFFQEKSTSGEYSRPKWQGRIGSQEVTKGTFLRARGQPKPRLDLPQVMRMLQSYTMCAFRNSAANFTFPEQWRRRGMGKSREEIKALPLVNNSEVIDTPLVTFCVDCVPMASSAAFRFACLGDTIDYTISGVANDKGITNALYGSYQFWQMRSLIRWYPKHLKLAADFMAEQGLAGKKYTSLLLRHSQYLKRRCSTLGAGNALSPTGRQLYHAQWLKANFGEAKSAQFTDLFTAEKDQCMPLSGFKAALGSVVNDYEAFYVSVRSTTREAEAAMLQDLKEALGDKKVVVMAPATLDEDVVDLIVASQGAGIVANRFCDHSQVVAEEFLMNKKFNPDGIRFW